MRLLLVEDEPEIQDFLKQPLANAGYEVDTAKDGRTAIQLASATKYDALIIDLGLPDQDACDSSKR
jgi:DNA-binding response OmpR family regulator